MRIHVLQHVPFEDEANLGEWAREKGHALSKTLLYENEPLPTAARFDWLLILGGPMSVNDQKQYPWLAPEKKLIQEAITKGKIVLGICLGAQLIANVLGARVYPHRHKEIGWHKVTLTNEAERSFVFGRLPKSFIAFHWHGETFDLPPGCVRMAASDACLNQAFEYGGRVAGLQFHLESSEESICRLIQNCPEDLAAGKYVQTAQEMLPGRAYPAQIKSLMAQLLDGLCNAHSLTG